MKPVSKLGNLFAATEILNQNQSLKVKGGDDKHPPLPLPGQLPPVPRPNSCWPANFNSDKEQ